MVYPRLRENPGSTRRFTSAVMDDLPGRVSLLRFVEAVEHAAVRKIFCLGVVPALGNRGDGEALQVGEIRGVPREHGGGRRAGGDRRDGLLAFWGRGEPARPPGNH